jgi:hypothetical protein
VSLEELGVPAAVIVTTEFVREAGNQAQVLGMPEFKPVVIDHPLSTLSSAQIGERADQAVPQVTQAWTS